VRLYSLAMENADIHARFSELTTPHVADAAVRLGVDLRVGPAALRPVGPHDRIAGRATPARHYGSVDIFLEAMRGARPADVLVIDNGGRIDEACIGDLTVLETRASGLSGIVVWGLHRDTVELTRIGFPVFSCGVVPVGPRRLDPVEPNALHSARLGDHTVTADDVVFGDADGVVVVPHAHVERVLATAKQIATTERRQAEQVRAGITLAQQLRFDDYLARRRSDPAHTFRAHLRAIGGAIEE
jgi:4-hydroxy-4-methyl-2-oxoglutarate aldolase